MYEMSIRERGLTETMFRDSWNLVSRPLDDLVAAYGLKDIYGVEPKSIFPHGFNDPRNYTLPALPHLPPIDLYYPDGMKPAKREKFMEMYTRE